MPNNPFQNLPQGWEVKTLGELCEIISKGATPKIQKSCKTYNNDVAFLKAENITINGDINFNNVKFIDYGTHIQTLKRSILKNNDILITIAGSLARCAIVEKSNEIQINLNQAIAFARLKDNNTDSRFIKFFILSPAIQTLLFSQAKTTAVPNLTLEIIKSISIPLPPLEIQQKIVAKLESEFAKIEAAKGHLEKVKDTIPRLKNSLLKSAFSGELTCQKMSDSASAIEIAPPNTESNTQTPTFPQTPNIGGTTLVAQNLQDCTNAMSYHSKAEKSQTIDSHKNTALRDISATPQYDKMTSSCHSEGEARRISTSEESHLPQGWKIKTLGEITNYGKTTQKQPKDLKPNDWILELEDIKKESGMLLNKIAFKDRQSKSNKIIFYKGNVLFGTLRPYLKKVIIADDDGYCSSEIMPFDSGNKITNHYLAYLFLSDFMGNKIAMLTYGTRMPRLGTKNGKELPIPLPPLETQKQIVEILDSKFATLENLEKETNASLEKLHKIKSSLLNQAFKGELI